MCDRRAPTRSGRGGACWRLTACSGSTACWSTAHWGTLPVGALPIAVRRCFTVGCPTVVKHCSVAVVPVLSQAAVATTAASQTLLPSPCCLTSCAASHRAASPLVLPSPSPGAATGEQRLPFNGLGGHSGPVSAVALRSTPEKRLFVYSSSYDCTVTRLFLYALYRLQRSAQPTANHTA